MGGTDKGLQALNGVAMVVHVMAILAPQVGSLMINANRNLDAYRSFGVPVWADANDEFAGPLAGLQAGLKHCPTPFLVTAPCDSPFLPHDLVVKLAAALESAEADIAVAAIAVAAIAVADSAVAATANTALNGNETAATGTIQTQPVFMLLRTTLIADLTTYLNEGGRKMETWYRRHHYIEVLFPDALAFRNINTPDELREADNPDHNQ